MLTRIESVLGAEQLARCVEVLAGAPLADGKATAGQQSAEAKHNLQIPADDAAARELGELVLGALGRNQAFIAAALPLRVYPPMFSLYAPGMDFGPHVDNAVRFGPGGARYRADIACTLFLSDPASYQGGELIIEDRYGPQSVKLAAGDLVVYPASSVHRVEPIAAGRRWAAIFWVQSMVQDETRRSLLSDLDRAVMEVRGVLGDEARAAIELTGVYHNLLRMWAEV
jgi:PKHD-type hydroxylase